MRRRQNARLIPARSLALATILAGATIAGCGATRFSPEGTGFSEDRFTYVSTSTSPKTVALVDIRTDQVLWSVDVPVGQKLTMKFESVIDGENPVFPDVMEWVVQPVRLNSWRGSQQMLVPGPEARLIEMSLRPTPEYPGDVAAMPEAPAFEPVDIEPDADDEPLMDEPMDEPMEETDG